MDIAKRIANLGEYDAKAALLHMIQEAEKVLWCDSCPCGCDSPSREKCMDFILDKALEEVRS